MLNKEPVVDVDPNDYLAEQVALSIDFQFKNQRHHTNNQAVDMVLRWRIIAMGFDIRVRQYWELLKILKMFTIPGSVVAKLKFIENGVLNVKLNIFHKAVLQPT